MGCGCSKPDSEDDQRPHPVIGAPQDVSIHVPRNRANRYGVPSKKTTHDIPRPALRNALNLVASHLHQRGAQLTVVGVGGAVNTIFLQTRETTHDVDFFGSNLDTDARILLDNAMEYAIQQSQVPLGTDWFNTETQMWLSPDLHKELTREAFERNVVVFASPGLTILAAPWEYAFSAKVSRVLTGEDNARPYDLADAVHYLHQVIQANGGRPIPLATVLQWAKKYNHNSNKDVLVNRVNVEYRRIYDGDGIV